MAKTPRVLWFGSVGQYWSTLVKFQRTRGVLRLMPRTSGPSIRIPVCVVGLEVLRRPDDRRALIAGH